MTAIPVSAFYDGRRAARTTPASPSASGRRCWTRRSRGSRVTSPRAPRPMRRAAVDGRRLIGLNAPPADGGRSSVGRAPGCGLGCRGFESHRSPHPPLVKRRALTVAIGGLGAIGLPLARALDRGVEGLRLIAVARPRRRARAGQARRAAASAGDHRSGRAGAGRHRGGGGAGGGVRADRGAGDRGGTHPRAGLGRCAAAADGAGRAGAGGGCRIVVPTGALLGLDAVRAAAEGEVTAVEIETRKPPGGLAGAPYLAATASRSTGLTRRDWCSRATRGRPPPASRPMSTSPPHSHSPASGRSGRWCASGPTPR